VPPSNRWHVTNLLLNLLLLTEAASSLRDEVLRVATSRIDLDDRADVRDAYGENRRLAALLNLTNAEGIRRIPGPFGDFQDRTGIAIPYYFIWS
jgi:hypothetical protein